MTASPETTQANPSDALPKHWQALQLSFDSLKLINPEWPQRAFQFVLDGSGPELLQELAVSQDKPGELLGQPGVINAYFYNLAETRRKPAERSRDGRGNFLGLATADNCTLAQFARFGRLLEAATQGQELQRPGAAIPDWLQYLLNSICVTKEQGFKALGRASNTPALLNCTLLAALLESEGERGMQVMAAVFERKGISDYHWSNYEPLLKMPDLSAFLLANPVATRALPGTLSASGRQLLTPVLAAPALAIEFADVLVRLSVDDAKSVRVPAAQHLAAVPLEQRLALLDELLRTASAGATRVQVAELLGRILGAASRALLETARARETSKAVLEAINQALSRHEAAAGGGEFAWPPMPPYEKPVEQALGAEAFELLSRNHVELLEKARLAAEAETASNLTAQYKHTWARSHYVEFGKIDHNALRSVLGWLEGGPKPKLQRQNLLGQVLGHGGRLAALPQFTLLHLMRAIQLQSQHAHLWGNPQLQQWLAKQNPEMLDLRQFADALVAAGEGSPRMVAGWCLSPSWNATQPQQQLPIERVWPFFAQHELLLDEALGLVPAQEGKYQSFELSKALELLGSFPAYPPRYIPRLMELALGEAKTHREPAQAVLARLPDLGSRVCEALSGAKSELRIVAAQWLAELGYQAGIPALQAALAKETRETVRAALLAALEKLGVDISALIAPEVLLREAEKGMKAKPPAGLSWFAMDALPALRWRAGSAVPGVIPRWWIVLAVKLKEPGGNALLERYLSALDESSRATLGQSVLSQFLAHDARQPTNEEALAYAEANYAPMLANYQQWAKTHPDYYAKYTKELVIEQLKADKLSKYLGTAIGEKGMLALISGVPGHQLVSQLQSYMREHINRRAQSEALLEAAAQSSDPSVIQLLLGISRRYRTAGVQERARQLVEQIATRMGWSQDELADRTIPSAGFDERGELLLEYGERNFTVLLDAAMKPLLRNAEGKEVKALPEPRKSDPPEQIKLAKTQLSTCKKELKQVLDMQTARLYEAMCAGRSWQTCDWREYLLKHPIVSRLLQRLIWVEKTDDGERLFRPSEDGALLDADDEELQLSDSAQIRLAHAALLDASQIKAWTQHLKDYKVKPLFAQLARLSLPEAAYADTHSISDRMGHASDAFTLRGTLNKLGYQRAAAEDGGVFDSYYKDFPAASIKAVIAFTGNALPEENVYIALRELRFQRLGKRNYGDASLPLREVPPVLLAEAYADYHATAAAGTGFDPEWEKKSPWG